MMPDSLQSVKTQSPLQVFALFAVGIILPSAFLSFLGWRSFQYEGALMQKKTEEQYAAVANLMQKEADNQVTQWVTALRTLGNQRGYNQPTPSEIIPQTLNTPQLNNLAVEHLFVFDEDDRMIAPWPEESGRGGEFDNSRRLDWGVWNDDIQALEKSEFVEKNISKAIAGYVALQSKHLSPTLQAELLKRIGGGYRKLHDFHAAEIHYEKLARDYDQLLDSSGYPTGVIARQILVGIYDSDANWARALDVRMDLFEGLMMRRWPIAPARRAAMLEELESAIPKILATHGRNLDDRQARWAHLRKLRDSLNQLKPICDHFIQRNWQDISKRLRLRGWLEEGGLFEMPGSDTLALVSPLFSAGGQRRRGSVVALVSKETVWQQFEQTVLELAKPVGLKVIWPNKTAAVDATRSRILFKSTLERQIERVDPPIRIQILESNSQDQNRLARRRLWIFGGMIGLSFVVIIGGLILMRRAVKREIEVANLKADFVANVSHELRTPLTTIAYIGERLNLGRYRTEEERKDFYMMLDKETGRLRGLIEDILDFSKMLAGKKVYRLEPIALAPLVQEAYERFQGKAQAKGFEVSIDLPPEDVTIQGDRKALLQAILNLLDNALKYSGQSRKIELSAKRTADRAWVSIRDHGIGISDADREKIFEKFYRVENSMSRDSEGGVGLGLAMVKHIMDGHQGVIRVESRLGEGSTFTFDFPLAKSAFA